MKSYSGANKLDDEFEQVDIAAVNKSPEVSVHQIMDPRQGEREQVPSISSPAMINGGNHASLTQGDIID